MRLDHKRRISLMVQPPIPSAQASAPRIIIADDHEWIRHILVDVVRQTLPTAEIIATEDGLQALRAYRDKGCDFLISNHSMPQLDGEGLIRAVREQAPMLPILMVSVRPEAKLDAMTAGANWFLLKEDIMERMPPLLLHYTGQ